MHGKLCHPDLACVLQYFGCIHSGYIATVAISDTLSATEALTALWCVLQGMPYEDFVLNIQPDDYTQLNERVAALLESPTRLKRMQEVLQAHQRAFLWAADESGGVLANIERELAMRAARLASGGPSVLSKRRQLFAARHEALLRP